MGNPDTLFVAKVDVSLAEKLRQDLEERGFELSQVQHTLVAGKKRGVSCTLYSSGKLVVQGKATREFVEFYLEPELLGAVGLMDQELDTRERIGTDEAGKGDFYGPLCVAGVYASESEINELSALRVADSKILSDGRARELARSIANTCAFDVMVLKPSKYNELYERFRNLNRLLAWAHSKVIANLHRKTGCNRALVDQFEANGLLEAAVQRELPRFELSQRPRAESDLVVAAASILARAAFIKGLNSLSQEVSIKLPKGASSGIHEAGRKLVAAHGPDILRSVAKLHFKTTREILG